MVRVLAVRPNHQRNAKTVGLFLSLARAMPLVGHPTQREANGFSIPLAASRSFANSAPSILLGCRLRLNLF